ncbi:MAG: isoprenoid biosynthesis glyoxalase ElbB [Myxococcota bacterium]|nr:isoprenoid biosynthesis glyoxalase ElbB [Myxococcota bacterium]
MSQKKVGVILAGCGWLDGAEIHEAVCTYLALDQRGVDIVAMAPNVDQMHVIDHLEESPVDHQSRNVLVESARIARGQVRDIATVQADEFDALILPGGFGAAKNLCNFAVAGTDLSVNPDVERLIKETHAAQRPIGFICIAPVIAAKVLGPDHQVAVTIGGDEGTAQAIEALGATHVNTAPGEIHIDEDNRVVSTPAYMLGPSIAPVFEGIDALVAAVVDRIA